MESKMNSEAIKPPSVVHNNSDLSVYACYLAGGYERWLDVEELYLKAFELAPARLSWRTRPDLPDYKKCNRIFEVSDPTRGKNLQRLLLKRGKYQCKLSDEGYAWCMKYASILQSLYKGGVVPTAAVQEASRMIRNLEKTEAFKKFSKTENIDSPLWELAEAFQCMVDSDDVVWAGRFDQMTVLAQNNYREDVLQFIELSRQRVLKDPDAEKSHD
jgi:hypothetical protein